MQPTMYRICIRGRVTERLGSASEGMRPEAGGADTVLTARQANELRRNALEPWRPIRNSDRSVTKEAHSVELSTNASGSLLAPMSMPSATLQPATRRSERPSLICATGISPDNT